MIEQQEASLSSIESQFAVKTKFPQQMTVVKNSYEMETYNYVAMAMETAGMGHISFKECGEPRLYGEFVDLPLSLDQAKYTIVHTGDLSLAPFQEVVAAAEMYMGQLDQLDELGLEWNIKSEILSYLIDNKVQEVKQARYQH